MPKRIFIKLNNTSFDILIKQLNQSNLNEPQKYFGIYLNSKESVGLFIKVISFINILAKK